MKKWEIHDRLKSKFHIPPIEYGPDSPSSEMVFNKSLECPKCRVEKRLLIYNWVDTFGTLNKGNAEIELYILECPNCEEIIQIKYDDNPPEIPVETSFEKLTRVLIKMPYRYVNTKIENGVF